MGWNDERHLVRSSGEEDGRGATGWPAAEHDHLVRSPVDVL
jgi:hypothetical protein